MFHTENNELLIIGINTVIVLSAYFLIYPKFAGSNLKNLAINDVIASSISLLISGSIFWGKEINFNALLFTTNWFWFSILTYLVIELPFVARYMKKYAIEIG